MSRRGYHFSNSYNTNTSGGISNGGTSNGSPGSDDIEGSRAAIFGNFPPRDLPEMPPNDEDTAIEDETEEKPTALLQLDSTEDLIKEFFSAWPQGIDLQLPGTTPDDVEDIGPQGKYDPGSNSSLEFTFKNVEMSKQPFLFFGTHPLLWMVKQYYIGSMDRKAIDSTVNGLSASKWTTSMLRTLHCVHLPKCHIQAIIPNFEQRKNKVLSLLQTYKMATFMYESIKQPEESELREYGTSKHISHFLLNPWLPVFLSLRDLVSIGNTAAIQSNSNASNSIPFDSRIDAERKIENMTEQLLHRFMEITLVLFSIICNERDELRSTPTRGGGFLRVGSSVCEIQDDGYIYVARKDKVLATTRYGRTPVIRFEAKRKKSGNESAVPQIFSELLSAAALNREYDIVNRVNQASDYHDAFVIQLQHYTLTIHTARFPSGYLKWVTDRKIGTDAKCKEKYAILHKESVSYDLSKQKGRQDALRDVLTLLWAIKHPAGSETDKPLYVARTFKKANV